jgi:hypothetical protein
MADVKNVLRDMVRQRRVQAVTGALAAGGIFIWMLGYAPGQYVAAGAIILFTVATLRWIDDEEVVEKESGRPDKK